MNARETRLHSMLKTALEMEERGFEFYKQAVETCRDEAARELFRTLQMDEVVHMKRIRTLFAAIEGGEPWTEEWRSVQVERVALDQMFREIAKKQGTEVRPDTADVEAVDVGIDFEAKAVRFYEERLGEAEGPDERRFLEAMIGEERSHYQALQDTRLYLTDPAAWFAANEGGHVDGG